MNLVLTSVICGDACGETLPGDVTSSERNTTTTVVALTVPHHDVPWPGWLGPLSISLFYHNQSA